MIVVKAICRSAFPPWGRTAFALCFAALCNPATSAENPNRAFPDYLVTMKTGSLSLHDHMKYRAALAQLVPKGRLDHLGQLRDLRCYPDQPEEELLQTYRGPYSAIHTNGLIHYFAVDYRGYVDKQYSASVEVDIKQVLGRIGIAHSNEKRRSSINCYPIALIDFYWYSEFRKNLSECEYTLIANPKDTIDAPPPCKPARLTQAHAAFWRANTGMGKAIVVLQTFLSAPKKADADSTFPGFFGFETDSSLLLKANWKSDRNEYMELKVWKRGVDSQVVGSILDCFSSAVKTTELVR